MKAETAYHVIQALPEEEMHRLYRMLGVEAKVIPLQTNNDDKHWTVAEAKEYLMRLFQGQAERRVRTDKKQNPALKRRA